MAQETPLYSALLRETKKNKIRMHMPGHKGRPLQEFDFTEAFAIDYTELAATGNLYQGIPPISDAQALMAQAVGANQCLFLTCGSTQGIMTALAIAAPVGSTILLDRGCHQSVWNAMAHLDLLPQYVYPGRLKPWEISAPLNFWQVEAALQQNPQVSCVLITSPTYYGVLSDIEAIAKVTQEYRVPLIVDEAHGAHLPYLNGYQSAVAQGATFAVASAHKTLPALTPGAMLFSNGCYPAKEIRQKAAMFGTSSPSYLVMASMDVGRAYLQEKGEKQYEVVACFVYDLRGEINSRGIFVALQDAQGLHLDPTRLTINTSISGLTGYDAAKVLEDEAGIVCEMADQDNIVLIFTCMDQAKDLQAIRKAIRMLEKNAKKKKPPIGPLAFLPSIRELTPRQAAYSPKEYLTLKDAAGKIAGEHISPYPPGIPVVACGEKITVEHLAYLQQQNFDLDQEIAVLKS